MAEEMAAAVVEEKPQEDPVPINNDSSETNKEEPNPLEKKIIRQMEVNNN